MAIEMTTEKKIIDCKIIMKEIDPIAETDHIVETDQGITTKEIDHNISTEITEEIGHKVEISHKGTTMKMTIEMSIEMTIRRKIIGISKTRDMQEDLEITMKTLIKTGTARIRIGIIIETDTVMTVMTRLGVGLRKKITWVMMMIYFTQKLKECTKLCNSNESRERNGNKIYVSVF